jgi:hypothetical protein
VRTGEDQVGIRADRGSVAVVDPPHESEYVGVARTGRQLQDGDGPQRVTPVDHDRPGLVRDWQVREA